MQDEPCFPHSVQARLLLSTGDHGGHNWIGVKMSSVAIRTRGSWVLSPSTATEAAERGKAHHSLPYFIDD